MFAGWSLSISPLFFRMGTGLMALIIGLGLGLAVVALGWRRNLDETTRSGRPVFGASPEGAPEMARPPVAKPRQHLSPKQARWLAAAYLLLALVSAAPWVGSSDHDVTSAIVSAGFACCAVVLAIRSRS